MLPHTGQSAQLQDHFLFQTWSSGATHGFTLVPPVRGTGWTNYISALSHVIKGGGSLFSQWHPQPTNWSQPTYTNSSDQVGALMVFPRHEPPLPHIHSLILFSCLNLSLRLQSGRQCFPTAHLSKSKCRHFVSFKNSFFGHPAYVPKVVFFSTNHYIT